MQLWPGRKSTENHGGLRTLASVLRQIQRQGQKPEFISCIVEDAIDNFCNVQVDVSEYWQLYSQIFSKIGHTSLKFADVMPSSGLLGKFYSAQLTWILVCMLEYDRDKLQQAFVSYSSVHHVDLAH